MSKDIWHNADEIPDFNKSYVELSRSLQGDLVYSTWGHPNYITKNTIKWCYMDDLLALETEMERTRKALDVAVDALKDNLSQANFTQMLDASRFHCIRTKCETALEQITALEQKDK